MKRILLTTVSIGVLGLMSPAFGADLPTYSKAPTIAAPVYDWTGVYFGAFGGGGYGNHNINNSSGNTGTGGGAGTSGGAGSAVSHHSSGGSSTSTSGGRM